MYVQMDAAETAYWQGLGAELLGLDGEVKLRDFNEVREGYDPASGEKLRLYAGRGNATSLYDCVEQAPKTVSILAMHDRRLVDAHYEAVRYVQRGMESMATTRAWVDGETKNRLTQNLVQGIWHHQTSRAGDPHLHTHLVTVNMTYDPQDGQWRALNPYSMMRYQRDLSEVYRYVMAQRVEQLGYRTIDNETGHGFQIEGVPKVVVEKYSQRTRELGEVIDNFRLHHGRNPTPGEQDILVSRHRPEKEGALVSWDIRERQLERLTPDENRALIRVHEQALERRLVYEINMPLESYRWQDQIAELKQISAPKMNADFSRDKIDPELLERAQRFAISDRIDHEPGLQHHPWTYAEESLRKGYRYRVA
jgi:conjugative relaxase-like TrwC/TraI family protein